MKIVSVMMLVLTVSGCAGGGMIPQYGNMAAIDEFRKEQRERRREQGRVDETYRVRVGGESHTVRIRGNSISIY